MKNKSILKFVIVYFIVRGIGSLSGFSYNVLTDSFDIMRLAADLAMFAVVWFPVSWVFDKVVKDQKSEDALK